MIMRHQFFLSFYIVNEVNVSDPIIWFMSSKYRSPAVFYTLQVSCEKYLWTAGNSDSNVTVVFYILKASYEK